MTIEERLAEALKRTLPKLGPEARAQLETIIEPGALAIMAGVLTAWVVSHAFGLGEIIDVIVLVAGVASIGWAVFTAIDHLYEFATRVYSGRTNNDCELAADHLAKAIALIGIQAVLAVLFRGAKVPKTGKGGRVNVGTPPPRTPGWRYKPTVRQDPNRPAGSGVTSVWGDIVFSSQGSATERALVLLHEKVHQFLTPKLYLLRGYRVSNMAGSYVRSSLWRYIEEALAETVAQVGVKDFRSMFIGIKFPIDNGYVFFMKGGGFDPMFAGAGIVPELGALLYTGVVAGIAIELRFLPQSPPAYAAAAAH